MKYIDAEKLAKAIEDKGLNCSFSLKMERLDTLALIDELQQEQPEEPDKDLEEAANEFANQDCVTFISRKKGFIAGAKWQKEQMLKEAVEGEVVKDISNKLAVTAKINLDGFKFGDKVRIIVLPKED